LHGDAAGLPPAAAGTAVLGGAGERFVRALIARHLSSCCHFGPGLLLRTVPPFVASADRDPACSTNPRAGCLPLKHGKTAGYRSHMNADLLEAVNAALGGDWHRAHTIVQQYEHDRLACWIHAVLHKIEGDAANSRYWYARTSHSYGEFADAAQELAAIKREVERAATRAPGKAGGGS
jgi:hypothetical protein